MRYLQRALAALSLSIATVAAVASTAAPVNNTDYQTLDKAVPTDSGSKIEVDEFFSYSCPHCNAFDPELAAWVKAKGDTIVFKRVPLRIHEGDELLQKLYYTLEAMGITEQLHSKVFNAIHVQRKPFGDENQVADIVSGLGVDRAKFLGVFESFGVQTKLQRGIQLAELYKVSGVPELEIDGHYKASIATTEAAIGRKPQPELAAATLSVADWLIAKAAKEHKPQATTAKK
ncbi:MAG TPA: thiol:disulfide interchange protein DsbA/DsbL [Burkholderiaceae bacterium]|jgi:thiol:disulfide interchange protein DsbA|nr:thiol:disulfide interchange protein DsbA/DsbL [Burkholderiaceae bacterium]